VHYYALPSSIGVPKVYVPVSRTGGFMRSVSRNELFIAVETFCNCPQFDSSSDHYAWLR
jgi:hypothetical protein